MTTAQVQKEAELAAGQASQPGQPAPATAHETPPGKHKHHAASTAVTLARRAANILGQAQDAVIFQGSNAFSSTLSGGSSGPAALISSGGSGSLLFATSQINPTAVVLNRGIPLDNGLLCMPGQPNPLPTHVILPPSQVIKGTSSHQSP